MTLWENKPQFIDQLFLIRTPSHNPPNYAEHGDGGALFSTFHYQA